MIKGNPLKIEIETTNDVNSNFPFVVKINGKILDNVKRFYLDLDKDKILEKDIENPNITNIKPLTYGIEYEYDMVQSYNLPS